MQDFCLNRDFFYNKFFFVLTKFIILASSNFNLILMDTLIKLPTRRMMPGISSRPVAFAPKPKTARASGDAFLLSLADEIEARGLPRPCINRAEILAAIEADDDTTFLIKMAELESIVLENLAVVQTISKLQSTGKSDKRKAYSRETTIKRLDEILPKFTILDLSFSDIKAGFIHLNSDIEDNVHYVLSQKMKCNAILTNNIKDFTFFKDITVVEPNLALLKQKIQ